MTPTVKRVVTLAISVIDNEARVLDTALAAQLGMADVHKVRVLIKGHLDELEAFGRVSARQAETGLKGGRPGTAYYLNRQQALLVCILSKTEKAKAVRATSKRAVGDASTVPHGQAHRYRFGHSERGAKGTVRQSLERVKAVR